MATMKKLILLALIALVMVGCETSIERNTSLCREQYSTIIVDSCEYLSHNQHWDMTHKGNCCFCKERRQKELKELVKQLKEK